jgi:hypothetical protein
MSDVGRPLPTDTDMAGVVLGARAVVMAEVSSRRAWWRRLSRSTVIVGAVGAVAAGGIAYAAVERTADQPPETHKGSSAVEIGTPATGDKWLNVSVSFRCEPGESFVLRDAKSKIFSYNCGHESTSSQAGLAGRGLMKSIPVHKVRGTRLVMTSDLSSNYLVTATCRWWNRPHFRMTDRTASQIGSCLTTR